MRHVQPMMNQFPTKPWRARRKMTLTELARQAGVVKSHLSAIEQGKKRPSRDLCLRLSDITNIPLRRIAEFRP